MERRRRVKCTLDVSIVALRLCLAVPVTFCSIYGRCAGTVTGFYFLCGHWLGALTIYPLVDLGCDIDLECVAQFPGSNLFQMINNWFLFN